LNDINKNLKNQLCLLNEKVDIYQNPINQAFLDKQNKFNVLEIPKSQISFQSYLLSNENANINEIIQIDDLNQKEKEKLTAGIDQH
jgi:hypothetical protein